jgi:hypothetical protein
MQSCSFRYNNLYPSSLWAYLLVILSPGLVAPCRTVQMAVLLVCCLRTVRLPVQLYSPTNHRWAERRSSKLRACQRSRTTLSEKVRDIITFHQRHVIPRTRQAFRLEIGIANRTPPSIVLRKCPLKGRGFISPASR